MDDHAFEAGPAGLRAARVRAAMASRAADGLLVGKARIGYRGVRTGDGTLPRPDPAVAPLLRAAFELAAGGTSYREVLAWLREQGVKGSRGEPLGLSTLQRILSDPYYAGLAADAGGHLVPARHEGIVSPELFRAAQRRIAVRRYGRINANGTPQPID